VTSGARIRNALLWTSLLVFLGGYLAARHGDLSPLCGLLVQCAGMALCGIAITAMAVTARPPFWRAMIVLGTVQILGSATAAAWLWHG
jgi:hypothetical protein